MAGDNKYQNGKIYKITNTVNNDVYIGSTIRSLKERMIDHKSKYKNTNDNYKYSNAVFKMFENCGSENCNIELIKDYPCNSKNELEIEEGKIIRNCNCININKNIGMDKNENRRLSYIKWSERIICDKCGGKYNKLKKSEYIKHLKSRKHINYLKNNITYIDDNNKVKINMLDEIEVF